MQDRLELPEAHPKQTPVHLVQRVHLAQQEKMAHPENQDCLVQMPQQAKSYQAMLDRQVTLVPQDHQVQPDPMVQALEERPVRPVQRDQAATLARMEQRVHQDRPATLARPARRESVQSTAPSTVVSSSKTAHASSKLRESIAKYRRLKHVKWCQDHSMIVAHSFVFLYMSGSYLL